VQRTVTQRQLVIGAESFGKSGLERLRSKAS
jgi:hypothetical protein